MLYYNGRFDYAAMKKERIPKNEILQAVRSNGHASTEEILAVVLETDGTFSVIKKPDDTSAEHSSLENVSTATDAEQKKEPLRASDSKVLFQSSISHSIHVGLK